MPTQKYFSHKDQIEKSPAFKVAQEHALEIMHTTLNQGWAIPTDANWTYDDHLLNSTQALIQVVKDQPSNRFGSSYVTYLF